MTVQTGRLATEETMIVRPPAVAKRRALPPPPPPKKAAPRRISTPSEQIALVSQLLRSFEYPTMGTERVDPNPTHVGCADSVQVLVPHSSSRSPDAPHFLIDNALRRLGDAYHIWPGFLTDGVVRGRPETLRSHFRPAWRMGRMVPGMPGSGLGDRRDFDALMAACIVHPKWIAHGLEAGCCILLPRMRRSTDGAYDTPVLFKACGSIILHLWSRSARECAGYAPYTFVVR